MLEIIAAPANLPFSVALLLMLMIGAVEALGLGPGGLDGVRERLDGHAERRVVAPRVHQ